MLNHSVGEPIPADTPHAISASLPTWKSVLGYERGEKWVTDRMQCGYPRFVVHPIIRQLESLCMVLYRISNEDYACMLFPSENSALQCRQFLVQNKDSSDASSADIRTIEVSPPSNIESWASKPIYAVIYKKVDFLDTAKSFWQHTGAGITSRQADRFLKALQKQRNEVLSTKYDSYSPKPPSFKKFQNKLNKDDYVEELSSFVEERFGRHRDYCQSEEAKAIIKRRICGSIQEEIQKSKQNNKFLEERNFNARSEEPLNTSDTYLYSCGMKAIFDTFTVLNSINPHDKSVNFGFAYTDTLSIFSKWGPGSYCYVKGDDADLDHLEKRLQDGEQICALVTEIPSNPLLHTADIRRIYQLSRKYDFFVVIDETIGNYLNVSVLQYCDVLVSSLSKLYSGDANVLAGSVVLNPQSPNYSVIRNKFEAIYEDTIFAEDAIVLERNGRDFLDRSFQINDNTVKLLHEIEKHPKIEKIYYPSYLTSRVHYDAVKTNHGGYGGLFSLKLKSEDIAIAFYDKLDICKGPSLGTNFTLACPYTILAHYHELDRVDKLGVPRDLVRISIGLEPIEDLITIFQSALDQA